MSVPASNNFEYMKATPVAQPWYKHKRPVAATGLPRLSPKVEKSEEDAKEIEARRTGDTSLHTDEQYYGRPAVPIKCVPRPPNAPPR